MKVVKSRAFKDRLKGHKESILGLYSPYGENGFLLYSASKDGSVRAWDLAKREITIKLLLNRNPDQTVSYEPQNFNEPGKDATKEQKKNEEDKQSYSEELSAAAFSEHSVFGAYEDGVILEWLMKTGEIKNILKGHTQRISNMQFLPKQCLVSGSADSTIRVWNLAKGQSQVAYKLAGPVNKLRISGKEIHALANRNIFYQINYETNAVLKCIKFANSSLTSFIYHNERLTFGTIENKIQSYDLSKFDPNSTAKLQPVKVIEGVSGWVLEMKVLNGILYCGCDDRRIRVYTVDELKQVEQLAGHDDGVITIDFAGGILYTGSYDHFILSWDIKEMMHRIRERNLMSWEDLQSKKFEVYYAIAFKNKKKKVAKKKK